MPFDSTNSPQFSTPTTDSERRAKLLWYLRNDEETRTNWNFSSFKTCALGLCARLGFDHYRIGLGSVISRDNEAVFSRLYRHVHTGSQITAVGYGQICVDLVTPDMVADAIEHEANEHENP